MDFHHRITLGAPGRSHMNAGGKRSDIQITCRSDSSKIKQHQRQQQQPEQPDRNTQQNMQTN